VSGVHLGGGATERAALHLYRPQRHAGSCTAASVLHAGPAGRCRKAPHCMWAGPLQLVTLLMLLTVDATADERSCHCIAHRQDYFVLLGELQQGTHGRSLAAS
jgi:hypothetical protein